MIYSELIERVVQGVVRAVPKNAKTPDPPPLDRLRMRADAAFPQINSQVAEAFAGRAGHRRLLRSEVSLTFNSSGLATLPTTVLKKFVDDFELIVTPNSGQPAIYMGYLDATEFRRTQDKRMGKWKIDGLTVTARLPGVGGALVTASVASTVLSCISAPAVPAAAGEAYLAPDDMVPEVIDALINYLMGVTAENASQAA